VSDEQLRWRQIVLDLQDVMTIAAIAEEVQVEPRQVWRWKDGDRPLGMTAVRLYLLHVKRCPQRQGHAGHSQDSAKA
jgi:hypothetical protein